MAELGVRRAFGATKRDHRFPGAFREPCAYFGRRLAWACPFFLFLVAVARLAADDLVGRGGPLCRHVQRLCVLGGFSLLPGDEPDVGGYSGMAGVEGEYYGLYKQLMAYVTNDLHTTLE